MPESKKHTYESTTLGLPALKMVLVHSRNEAQNAGRRGKPAPAPASDDAGDEAPLDKEKAVRRLIEHLERVD